MGIIQEVSEIMHQHNAEHQNDVKPYNIFTVLGVAYKEVIMCRFLTDLLNPAGEHYKGSKYLRSFLRDVLHFTQLSDEDIGKCRVYVEFLIDQDRRIDIVIKNNEVFIPIEVKINAGEQESQCYDYYRYAVRKDENAKVVYLTKNGTPPTSYSTTVEKDGIRYEMPKDKIICVSFQDDIRLWLEKILESEQGDMYQIISQFLWTIRKVTGAIDEKMKAKIQDVLIKNEENFKSGLEIAKIIDAAKAELIVKVMQEFEIQMKCLEEKYSLEKDIRADWYSYETTANEQFYKTYSTYPGLNYVVTDCFFKNKNQKMWFRIEVEHNLFAGFCMFDYSDEAVENEGNQIDKMDDVLKSEIMEKLDLEEVNNDDWWIVWKYLPTGDCNSRIDYDLIPNFKEMNEAAIRLADVDNRKEFVAESIKVIEQQLLRLLK